MPCDGRITVAEVILSAAFCLEKVVLEKSQAIYT